MQFGGSRTLLACLALSPFSATAQQAPFLDPTRASVSESATIQRAGVLQIETGIEGSFRAAEYRSQYGLPVALGFAVNDWLRIDLGVTAALSQKDYEGTRESGVGDTALGVKAIVRGDPDERLAIAVSYALNLPSADEDKGLGSGRSDHSLRLILNRTFGNTDLVFNVAYLNVGRTGGGRDSGAQAIVGIARELPHDFGVVAELYRYSIDEGEPRGSYALAALTYQINPRLRVDVGLRGGRGREAPNAGVFAGLSFGVADFYR